MHVAVEAVGNKSGGGQTVINDVLSQLTAADAVRKTSIFCSPDLNIPAHRSLNIYRMPTETHSYVARFLWHELGLREKCRNLGVDIVVCMNSLGNVASIPQVNYFQQGLIFCSDAKQRYGILSRLKLGLIKRLTKRSCRNADITVVQSQHICEKITTEFQIPPAQVYVRKPCVSGPQWCGTPDPDKVRLINATEPQDRYLYVGSNKPHKNLSLLFEAFERLRTSSPKATLFLTCDANHALTTEGAIIQLGKVDKATLRELYSRSAVLVMPSLCETVGLPLLEAKLFGLQIVAPNLPYAREFSDNSTLHFDPHDPDDFAQKMNRASDKTQGVDHPKPSRAAGSHLEPPNRQSWLIDIIENRLSS